MKWNNQSRISFGGDYNPEQWPEEYWFRDMEMLKELKADTLTINVFSWSKIQPAENSWNFDELDRIFDLAEENGMRINLATPTAAQPPWMAKFYPEMQPVDKYGRRRNYGARTQFCPNNRDYRRLSASIAGKLAERYGKRKSLALWHINNEYGTYCYCETCRQEFISWLKEKYKSLENLNDKWYTAFWGHTYHDWDEIQTVSALSELLPGRLGDRDGTTFQAMTIDYHRFMSASINSCLKNEADVIRGITPDIPITTNIWGITPWIDLFEQGEIIDVASWDSYPSNTEHWSGSSFRHDIVRSIKKGENFIIMEQTPSQQNWQDFNAQKRPGVMRLLSYQTVAHGSEGLLFFQVRQGRGACEKYHAALIPHADRLDTRMGRELKELGGELEKLGDTLLGARVKTDAALVMNWDNWWSVNYSSGPSIDLNYFDILLEYYRVLNSLNISVDIVRPGDDLQGYKMVVAPLLNMVRMSEKENLESYVAAGGYLITTYFSGIVDENDQVYMGGYPGALRNLTGIWVEEVDALYRDQTNQIETGGEKYDCGLICEVIHLEGAEAIACFREDYYAGMPAVTENSFGKGKVLYLGTQPDREYLKYILDDYGAAAGIDRIVEPQDDLEVTVRVKEGKQYLFLLNHSDKLKKVDPRGSWTNILTGEKLQGDLSIAGKDVLILES
ncbi:beta-galactosidase [Spirochaeta isovalerica]|uniref:Beta-galactosidase n=1 Tax=Spirochaeta isovalerica TaxID=150 RepID=A0A841RAL5_9SPIO|nr:beta-galactosidase [Spirochaeta isovalerica]MBB6480401.1 beta-galactosidase [Spirochaeta isovalerica]